MPSRKEILEMLSQGQIDVDRATELLAQARDAAEEAAPDESIPPLAPTPDLPPAPEPPPLPEAAFAPPPPPAPAPAPRAPEVSEVSERSAKSGKRGWLHIAVSELDTGRSRVRVNVPLGLVRFGMRMGARFTDELDQDTVSAVLRAIESEELSGTLLEVEDVSDNERVHIYVD